jgi:hypothetical protein
MCEVNRSEKGGEGEEKGKRESDSESFGITFESYSL